MLLSALSRVPVNWSSVSSVLDDCCLQVALIDVASVMDLEELAATVANSSPVVRCVFCAPLARREGYMVIAYRVLPIKHRQPHL